MTFQGRSYSLIITVIFLAYAIGRIVSSIPALDKPRELADTTAYLRISRQPISGIKFWGDSRPPVFPLLLKIANHNIYFAAAIQLGFSILAWGFLALMITGFIKPIWLQLFAFSLILLFSLDRHIAGWDFVMLTESLSISFFVLFIALGLWLLKGWYPSRIILLIVAAILLVFTRDTNAWLLLLLSGLMLLATILRWMDGRALILISSFVFIFLISNKTADLGGRWIFPLGNLIGRRILPNVSAVEFFDKSCGMPISPALLGLSGGFANANERALYNDPELGSFRHWLGTRGKLCYMRWLVANSMQSVGETLNKFEGLITFSEVDRFFSSRYDPLMPVKLGRIFYPERFAVWIWGYSTLAALVVIWKRQWSENLLWGVFVYLNLLIFPHLFLVWHGDAMAPERHALSVGVQLYLSFWILNILLVDYLWRRNRVDT